MIHPTAIIDPSAEIDEDVVVGPFSIIGKNVKLAKGNRLHSHVVLGENSTFGEGNEFFPYSAVGLEPQDKKYKKGDEVHLVVGSHNVFRENVTVNRGTVQDKHSNGVTQIGHHNLFMAYVHIAHDCQIADHTIMANNVSLAGHVKVQSHANLGGFCLINQFRTIGQSVFVGMGCAINKNLIPFMTYSNSKSEVKLRSLNSVGLNRMNYDRNIINRLMPIVRVIKDDTLSLEEIKTQLNEMHNRNLDLMELKAILDFINHPESIQYGIYT